jgi:chromate transport protein ChrA
MRRSAVGATAHSCDEDSYRLSLTFSQLMPGPLAVQLAVTLSYFQAGFAGASAAPVASVVPPLLLVLALSVLFVQLGGLWWMLALSGPLRDV